MAATPSISIWHSHSPPAPVRARARQTHTAGLGARNLKTGEKAEICSNREHGNIHCGTLWGLVVFTCLTYELPEVTWPARLTDLTRHQSFECHGLKPRLQSGFAAPAVHCQRWGKACSAYNIFALSSPVQTQGLSMYR